MSKVEKIGLCVLLSIITGQVGIMLLGLGYSSFASGQENGLTVFLLGWVVLSLIGVYPIYLLLELRGRFSTMFVIGVGVIGVLFNLSHPIILTILLLLLHRYFFAKQQKISRK